MLFHPASDLLWDTWVVEHDGLFYLFYIRVPGDRLADSPEFTFGSGWDAVNLATSPDLLHWTEAGTVLAKDPEAHWLGTGMIHRAGGQWIMNFSEERPRGCQVISFATSADLRTWTRLPRERDLRPDGKWYVGDAAGSANPLPRWDSLGIIPPAADRDGYLGVLAADAASPSLPGQCGVLGLMSSADGISWQPLPPATPPGLFASYEVPEHVELNGRHYVLFSTNTTAGARYVPATRSRRAAPTTSSPTRPADLTRCCPGTRCCTVTASPDASSAPTSVGRWPPARGSCSSTITGPRAAPTAGGARRRSSSSARRGGSVWTTGQAARGSRTPTPGPSWPATGCGRCRRPARCR